MFYMNWMPVLYTYSQTNQSINYDALNAKDFSLAHYARQYMFNEMTHVQRSFREFACTLNKFDWLKVDFWIYGPAAADTLHRGMIFNQSEYSQQPVSWILTGRKSFYCAMYLLPLDLVSKKQLPTNQNLFNACAISQYDRWTCIALHSVIWPTLNLFWFAFTNRSTIPLPPPHHRPKKFWLFFF